MRASALQFVRKISGFSKPSAANAEVFDRATEQVTTAVRELCASLVTNAPPRDRAAEVRRAKDRSLQRFAAHSH